MIALFATLKPAPVCAAMTSTLRVCDARSDTAARFVNLLEPSAVATTSAPAAKLRGLALVSEMSTNPIVAVPSRRASPKWEVASMSSQSAAAVDRCVPRATSEIKP